MNEFFVISELVWENILCQRVPRIKECIGCRNFNEQEGNFHKQELPQLQEVLCHAR